MGKVRQMTFLCWVSCDMKPIRHRYIPWWLCRYPRIRLSDFPKCYKKCSSCEGPLKVKKKSRRWG